MYKGVVSFRKVFIGNKINRVLFHLERFFIGGVCINVSTKQNSLGHNNSNKRGKFKYTSLRGKGADH